MGMLTLRKTISVMSLCLILTGGAMAQAPGPLFGGGSRPLEAQNQPEEQPTSTDQRGTDQSPLVVKVLPSIPSQSDSAYVAQEESGRSSSDWVLVFFVGLLVIVVAGQAVVFAIQAKLLRETVRYFMTGEGALVYPIEPSASLLLPGRDYAEDPEAPGVPLPTITCEFINVGRTAAVIKEVRGELFFGAQFPREPAYTYSQARRSENLIRPEKKTPEQKFEYSRSFTVGEIELIKERKVNVLFFGYVKYADIFGRQHTKGFGLVCRGTNKFQNWGGPGYNYLKSDDRPKYWFL
jgi:hypothetical protein